MLVWVFTANEGSIVLGILAGGVHRAYLKSTVQCSLHQ